MHMANMAPAPRSKKKRWARRCDICGLQQVGIQGAGAIYKRSEEQRGRDALFVPVHRKAHTTRASLREVLPGSRVAKVGGLHRREVRAGAHGMRWVIRRVLDGVLPVGCLVPNNRVGVLACCCVRVGDFKN